MVKLKDLLKEGSPGYKNRQFGDPLPTLKDIMKEKKMKDLELGKVYTDSDMPPFKVTEEVVDEATPSKSFFNGFKQLPLYKEMNPNQRQAASIALIMGGDMTGAVAAIEKIKKGLSKDKKVRNALRLANESVEESVDEGKTSNMMKAIRKHGTAGPWDIIVSKNNNIVKRVSVQNLKEIPAEMVDVKKKYPNHKIGIEAKSGKIAYKEQVLIERKEINGSYLMKQLKDLAKDVKISGEPKAAKALMYLHSRINQSYRDDDLSLDDVLELFKDPRGRQYAKDVPDWMIEDLF